MLTDNTPETTNCDHQPAAETMDLVHCIYASASTVDFTADDLKQLLAGARENNENLNITGMLLYDSGSFFQVLEGPREAVEEIYQQISFDRRHDRVTKLILESIEERSFAGWTMGYAGVSREELREIRGLNDFFSGNRCYTQLDEGRTKQLLAAFKNGRWRASLT